MTERPRWNLSIYETANGWYYVYILANNRDDQTEEVGPFPTEAEARADEAKTRPQTWDVTEL